MDTDVQQALKGEYFENMKACMVYLNEDNWGDEKDPTSNWSLAMEHATFTHREACEFIFYIGEHHIGLVWAELGFTLELLTLFRKARNARFNYICIHA